MALSGTELSNFNICRDAVFEEMAGSYSAVVDWFLTPLTYGEAPHRMPIEYFELSEGKYMIDYIRLNFPESYKRSLVKNNVKVSHKERRSIYANQISKGFK